MRGDEKHLNLPKLEEKILEFWEQNKIFEKTLAKTRRGKRFVFYEGPPTANAAPGIHHVEARAFKDLIPRYKTMQGFYVERKAGWDTHGLPVEIQVEKALGLKTKKDIERYGIAKFNEKCRESVWQFKAEWEKLTKRIGFWLDLEHPYITYETSYIESLWWVVKEIWKKKLLYQDFKVVPWCPRCQTGLSTHELGLGYKSVKDRSVYIKFYVPARDFYILSWTTTPWTLPGNVALAINLNLQYQKVRVRLKDGKDEFWVLAKERLSILDGGDITVVYKEDIHPRLLVGHKYRPLFDVPQLRNDKSYRIYSADFVSAAEGSGVVHTAVMYGEDDYQLGTKIGLPKFHTVTETGRFIKELGEGLGGLYVKDPKTEEKIIASLKKRGLLFKEELHEHEYPFCWRCDTPLLYYARNAWWVKMSGLRKSLLANNEKINWVPPHLKHGRFGEFLREARDWAFSRERYWGTPLPVWQCGICGSSKAVGSLSDLDTFDSAPTILFVMRHGEALHNVGNTMSPVSAANDRKDMLTERGRQQVLAAAARLKKEKVDAIVASPSFRAQQTARVVARELGLKRVSTIRELYDVHTGKFEGLSVKRFHAEFASFAERFTKKPGGAENLSEVRARMMQAIAAIRKTYRGKRVLVVSHGDPLWILAAALENLSEAQYEGAWYPKPGEFLEVRLHNWPYSAEGEVNLHKPYIDSISLRCGKCSGLMRRVPEVIDVWFDSGAMPFAQAHYPFAWAQNQKAKGKRQKLLYPADYISEAVDQTRGWFYTLLAVSTLLGRGPSYKNVISLGHVLDKNGQKMSKSKGNVVNPWDMIQKYGSDAIRWYFYTVNAPGDPKRFDEKDINLQLRGALATLWNSFVFFDTYVNRIKISDVGPPKSKNALDRWALLRVDWYIKEVTRWLDDYNIVGAARLLEEFIVGEFSNWYIRRSRRRFQRPDNAEQKNEAAAVTAFVLLRVVELVAPFTPFLAEMIYQELKGKLGLREESVHLRRWPKGLFVGKQKLGKRDTETFVAMERAQDIANLALAQRAKTGIKIRQPLGELKISEQEYNRIKKHGFLDVLKAEVNVKNISPDPSLGFAPFLDTTITPELREEGLIRELVRNIQEMRRDAGLKPQQVIKCQVLGSREIEAVVERWQRFIQQEAGVAAIQFGGRKKSPIVGREITLNGGKVWVGISKTRR